MKWRPASLPTSTSAFPQSAARADAIQEIRSCIEEIEKVGALPPLAPKERLNRQEPGVWLVRF